MKAKDARIISNFLHDLDYILMFHEKLSTILIEEDEVSRMLYSQNLHMIVINAYKIRDLERSMFLTDKVKLGIDHEDLSFIKNVRNQLLHGDKAGQRVILDRPSKLIETVRRMYHTLYEQLPHNIRLELDLDLDATKKGVISNFDKYFVK